VVEGVENSSHATNLEIVHTLIAASPSNPPLYQERQQLTDPLAVRFWELLPGILTTSLTSRRTLPRPNCVIQPESLQLLDDCILDSLTDSSDLWTLNCYVYTAAFVLLESRGKLKPHQPDERKETQKDELLMVRSNLACVSNELFWLKKNLRSCSIKEERIKSYLQDKYCVPLWNVRSLRVLHESLIQMLKVAMVCSNYNKSKPLARKLNSQFVRDQRSVYRDFQKSHRPQNVPHVSATEQYWKLLYSESQFDYKVCP